MADIQKLTDEILKEAAQKAEQILAEAKTQADHKVEEAKKASLAHKQLLLKRADQEAKLLAERIISGANLKLRDDKLSAKGAVIDRVLEKVREGVRNMPAEEELSYIVKDLKGRTLRDDETLIVKPGFAQKVKDTLGIAVVTEQEGVSGYAIDRKGVIENHSFETTLDYLKEDLEAQASQILFPN